MWQCHTVCGIYVLSFLWYYHAGKKWVWSSSTVQRIYKMLRCLDVLKRIETYSPWNAQLSYLNGEWTVRTRWVNTECTLGEWLVNRIWWVLMKDESVQRINRAQTRQQSEQQMHCHWYVNALWWQEDQFFWIAQELSSHCIYMYNVYSERMMNTW